MFALSTLSVAVASYIMIMRHPFILCRFIIQSAFNKRSIFYRYALSLRSRVQELLDSKDDQHHQHYQQYQSSTQNFNNNLYNTNNIISNISNINRSFSIYVLQLKNDKIYVGRSTNVEHRIGQHFSGKGSRWTNIHKPLKIIEVIHHCFDLYDEDKYTFMYMKQFGIDNVRGGSFTNTNEFTSTERKIIEKIIRGSNNECYRCGGKGHYASECQQQQLHQQRRIPDMSPTSNNENKQQTNNAILHCIICGMILDSEVSLYLHKRNQHHHK